MYAIGSLADERRESKKNRRLSESTNIYAIIIAREWNFFCESRLLMREELLMLLK
jgi:hypothetical protein